MSNKIKVGIVEDETEISEMLIYFINQQPDMECVLKAGSVEEFFAAAKDTPNLNVLIQDIGLPGMTGLDAIRRDRGMGLIQLLRCRPETSCIVWGAPAP